MNREEEDLLKILGPDAVGASQTVILDDNGAAAQIEDNDPFRDPVEVDENPYIGRVTDDDGYPGFRPFVVAAKTFEQREGLEAVILPSADDQVLGDEFHEEMRRYQKASVVGGQPVGDLAQLARVEQLRRQQQADIAQWVRTTPPTAQRGLLGNKYTIRPGPNNLPVQVINWTGEDIEAIPVTVSLFPIYALPGGASPGAIKPGVATIRAFARIEWGTHNGVQVADIDIGTGCQFTVAASVVNVYVGLDPASTLSLDLSASLGYYSTHKNAPLTLTWYSTALGMGGIEEVLRPSFASHVYFDRAVVASQFTLGFVPFSGGAAYTRVILANTYLQEPIKLAGDIGSVFVTNNGASSDYRLIWGLYL